ncbi:MAG: hypothetical protein FWH24_06200, partial [Oscillospiraceae bacterium]|nr:hypothetical protein [Oscillospiraceae bacterium]
MSKIKRFCIAFGLVLVFAVLVILIKPNLLFEPDAAAAVPPTERTAANSSVTEDRAEYTNNTEPPPAETYAEPLTDALIEIPAAEPPESLTEPQIESETEPQTEPQTEPETERQTEPETEQQTEPATELSIDRTPPSITVTVNNINISEDVTADIQEEQVINISASHSSGISEIQYTAGDEAAKIVQNSTASFWFTGAGFVDVKISAAAANGTVSEIHVYKLNIIAKPPPPPTEPPPPPP